MRFVRIALLGLGLTWMACGSGGGGGNNDGSSSDGSPAGTFSWVVAGTWYCSDTVQSAGSCFCNTKSCGGACSTTPCSAAVEFCCFAGVASNDGVPHCECAVQGRIGNEGCDAWVQNHAMFYSSGFGKVATCPPM
jgi:hypothetical protein